MDRLPIGPPTPGPYSILAQPARLVSRTFNGAESGREPAQSGMVADGQLASEIVLADWCRDAGDLVCR